jgi:hypothetical protein
MTATEGGDAKRFKPKTSFNPKTAIGAEQAPQDRGVHGNA